MISASYSNMKAARVVSILGILLIVTGVSAIVGWHTKSQLLIQISPAFPPVVYNTALCTVLAGTALLSLLHGYRLLLWFCATVITILGFLTLCEYLFSIDLGIDELFMQHDGYVKPPYPGRPAPNSALSFFLTGLALLFTQLNVKDCRLIAALSSIVFGLGFVVLTGHIIGLEHDYGWGRLPSMSLRGSLTFTIIGIGMLLFCWIQANEIEIKSKSWLAIPAGVLIITITISLWEAFHVSELIHIARFFILFFGISLAFVVIYILYLLQRAEENSHELLRLHDELEEKVRERTSELQNTRDDLELAMESGDMGTWKWDIINDNLVWDDNTHRLFGFKPGTFHGGMPEFMNLLHPDDRERVKNRIANNIAHQDIYDIDYRVIWSDGSIHTIASRGKIYKDKSGTITHRRGISWDVTDRKIAEEKLLLTQFTLDNSADCVYWITENGDLAYVNRSSCNTLGYSRDELMSMTIFDFNAEYTSREKWKKRWHKIRQENAFFYETRHRTSDGRIIPVEVWANYIHYSDREYACTIVRDITERKKFEAQLRENKYRLQTILDNAADSIIVIDDKGLIDSFNKAAEDMFGYKKEDVLGKNVNILMPEPDHSKHDQYLNNYKKTAIPRIIGTGREVIAKRRNGDIFPIEIAVSEVIVEKGRIFTGILSDISERKQHEKEIHAAKEAAESANVAKSRFLSNMSHELRTPLNAIIGYSEMLAEEAAMSNDEQSLSDLNKILSSGKHLLGLINDILDLSKIEAGKVEILIELFPVKDLIDEVVATAEPLMEKQGNCLNVEVDENAGDMHGDLLKTRQVLLNLMSNAAKFTGNGTVTLRVNRETYDGEDWLIFIVRDTGIGMSTRQMQQIFEEFSQADRSTTREYGGTGLGLTISRKLCHMMQGDISVNSVQGKGSTFTVRIPAKIEEQQNGKALDDHNDISKGIHPLILVIDDELHARDIMKRHLHKAGFEVAVARNGKEGLELAKKLRPTAITLDVLMPDMDGWEVIQAIKTDPDLASIPVVMCSCVDEKQRGFSLGVKEYLTKPINIKLLIKALNLYCRNSGCNILIVEDDSSQRQLMCREIERAGYTVFEAENGLRAMEKLREKIADVILLDLEMPEMDGFELVDAIQKNSLWRKIPVIIVTSRDMSPADRERLNNYIITVVSKGDGIQGAVNELRKLIRQTLDVKQEINQIN